MNSDILQNSWGLLLLYAPLGVIGAWRWSVWLWQTGIRLFYQPTPQSARTASLSLSVVTPVYNEDPDLFLRALLSWRDNTPREIIAVIDAADTRCIATFKRFSRLHQEFSCRLIVTEEPGKRAALARGAHEAQGEVIAFVDSDTVWDPAIRSLLLAPFADPRVGGVTPRQAVLRPETLAQKLFAIRLDLRYLHEFPYLSVVSNALTCLSGRTAVYRRSALLSVLPEMVHETFLGRRCISGEDKRLTSLILRLGWQVRYQQNAIVRTRGAPSLIDFFRQNLRWGRNSWRTDFGLLASARIWRREPLFGYHLLDRAVQPFTLLLGPMYLGVALALGHWSVAGIFLAWIVVSRILKLFPHLREHPVDIILIPAFTLSQYLLAVIKVYALSTLDYQSWITRWDAGRIKLLSFFELLPSRLATVGIVSGLAFAVSTQAIRAEREAEAVRIAHAAARAIPFAVDFSGFQLDEALAEFNALRDEHAFGTYAVRSGDTPRSLKRKWHFPDATLAELFPRTLATAPLIAGRMLSIPIAALQAPLDPTRLISLAPARIRYDPLTDAIAVKGQGSVVTLPEIAEALRFQGRSALLTSPAPGEWLLRSNLSVGEGVTLVIDGDRVSWLKLESLPERFVRLRAYNATVLIRGTKITSWDTSTAAPDTDPGDGRAYVIAQANGRMDVIDSEIAYLGYSRAVAMARRDRVGGVYGLSWKIPNDTIGRYLLTGRVTGNRIHHNYFGLYTFGATGLVIQNNEFFANVQYGIDPHDDSHHLLIADNFVHDNGNHGIIVSKRVVYSTISRNRSIDNRLHGLMLDRESNYNLVEDNVASGNVNGLALYDSHSNLVRGNVFASNRFGIRANMRSSANRFESNTITDNEKGVYLYGGAQGNSILNNRFTRNAQALSFKDTTGNIVMNAISSRDNGLILKTDAEARLGNFIRRFE